jgi:hypothetical protein
MFKQLAERAFITIALLPLFIAFVILSITTPTFAQDDDETFSSQAIGSFSHNNGIYDIWESKHNSVDKPQQWIFFFKPLFLAETENNILKTNTKSVNGKTIVSFNVLLWDNSMRQEAYQHIIDLYPDKKIQIEHILPVHIREVCDLEIPGLKEECPNCELQEKSFSFASTPKSFPINIKTPNNNSADKVINYIKNIGTLHYSISYQASTIEELPSRGV